MSLEIIIELAVLAMAIAAAWLSLKPAPPLDWERLWKVALATVIRGEVEVADGGPDQWWERLSVVPYHPAGRDAYAKLLSPQLDDIAVPALEGERQLVNRLMKVDTVSERADIMYREAEAASLALMADPAELGPAYDPESVLAPGVTWESIAAWDSTTQAAVARRLSDVVVAVVGRDTEALLQAVPQVEVVAIEGVNEAAFASALTESQKRLVVIAEGTSVRDFISLLKDAPGLRDRLLAVIILGTDLESDVPDSWIQTHFQHKDFDTELNRRTLYMAVTDPGEDWRDASGQRFPEPPVPPSGWAPIEAVDLGPLPIAKQDPRLLARALWILLTFCVVSR